MKGKIFKIITIVLIILFVVFGKKYIDYLTLDYQSIVRDSLNTFYSSGDKKDLDPIIEILNDYDSDSQMIKNVQNYSIELIDNWFNYLSGKYYCDLTNLTSCELQKEEIDALATKIDLLYNYSAEEVTIILPSSYRDLTAKKSEIDTNLNKVISSPRAKDPLTSEEIRLNRCKVATDCECRNGMCSCSYRDDNKTYSISCVDTSNS